MFLEKDITLQNEKQHQEEVESRQEAAGPGVKEEEPVFLEVSYHSSPTHRLDQQVGP